MRPGAHDAASDLRCPLRGDWVGRSDRVWGEDCRSTARRLRTVRAMSAHSSWRCCTAGSTRRPRAERPFVRPRRAELLTVRLRRSARALAIVDVCGYDPGCGHGALSPCLQAVRRSRAGRHLLVLGLRPGSAGPGRLGLEVETAPAKIFRYILVSSSSRGCLSAADDVSADGPIPSSSTVPRRGWSPWAPMAEPRSRPGWRCAPVTSARRYSAACGGRWAPCHTPKSARRCALLGQADPAHSTVCQATADPCVDGRPHSVPDRPPALLGPQVRGEPPQPIQSLVRHLAAPLRPLSRAMPARSESVPCWTRVLEFRVASPRGPCRCSWQCPFKDADPPTARVANATAAFVVRASSHGWVS